MVKNKVRYSKDKIYYDGNEYRRKINHYVIYADIFKAYKQGDVSKDEMSDIRFMLKKIKERKENSLISTTAGYLLLDYREGGQDV